jgi:hypothetical protein
MMMQYLSGLFCPAGVEEVEDDLRHLGTLRNAAAGRLSSSTSVQAAASSARRVTSSRADAQLLTTRKRSVKEIGCCVGATCSAVHLVSARVRVAVCKPSTMAAAAAGFEMVVLKML